MGWLKYVAIFGAVALVLALVLAASLIVARSHFFTSPKVMPAAAKAEVAMIAVALKDFRTANGRLPTTAETLQALVTKPASMASPATNWPFLQELPKDPWGNPYIYRCPSTNATREYDLLSAGPDGKEGTADDVSSWDP